MTRAIPLKQPKLTFAEAVLSHELGKAADTIPYIAEVGQTLFGVEHDQSEVMVYHLPERPWMPRTLLMLRVDSNVSVQ